jgi:protein involved in polysaccharide export with SLBB domain
MYKAFWFWFLLVLFSCSASPAIGQVTSKASRPSNTTNTEATRLLQEGIDLTDAGQLPQAVRAFEEAIKLDPHYAEAYAALGRAYFKMREWRRAVDNLRRAAALNATPAVAATVVSPTPSTQAAQPEPSEVKTQPAESPVNKPAPVEPVAQTAERSQETPPQETQGEKTDAEVSPSKTGAASAQEEKQEPSGVSVSMSSSPTSSTVESRGVTPIPLTPSNEDVSLTKVYRVGPGDVLDVRIKEAQPGQSTLFTVTPTGLLEHPMLAEPLNVSTLTTEEIETKIQDDLKKRALIDDPKVTVGVRDYASHSILVSGLVKESGTKFLRREAIPLYVVVADAQPLPEAGKVTVVRNELKQMFEIDLTETAEMSLLVRPGDVINLQPNETQFIYIGGEVKAPGEKIFRRGLTLTQAIISAGGMTSKSKVAEIGRDDGSGFLVKTSFNLKDIQTGKAMDPLIKIGDRIMILR